MSGTKIENEVPEVMGLGRRGNHVELVSQHKDEERRDKILKRPSGCWVGIDGGLA